MSGFLGDPRVAEAERVFDEELARDVREGRLTSTNPAPGGNRAARRRAGKASRMAVGVRQVFRMLDAAGNAVGPPVTVQGQREPVFGDLDAVQRAAMIEGRITECRLMSVQRRHPTKGWTR